MIYLCTGHYKATEEAKLYLNTTDVVKVSKINEGYFFDGPGKNTAIIFYPGAKVEYTAYAKLMYKVAENGGDCFLIQMPFNMAIFDINKAKKILNNYNYNNWYMAGHSMGGAMACSYTSNNPEKIKGVIAFAAYPAGNLPTDINYISIYGNKDEILNKEKYDKAKKYLPKHNEEYEIEGGNHSGFANYGNQKGDGKATITTDKQQEYVTDVLVKNGVLQTELE